jgi:glutathione synthase
MTRRVAIQMDPVGSINPKSDSTLALGLEAQKRGYHLYYYTPDQLALRGGVVTALAHRIQFFDDMQRWFELGESVRIDLAQMDVVLLRQDPPFDMTYLSTTYLLERVHPRTLVVNNPASVRNRPEKEFPFEFSEFMPPTLVTASAAEIAHFRDEFKDIVIKPLYGYGGRSVFRLKPDDDNFHALMETLFSNSSEPVMAQSFLPEVRTGDRRIILADGKLAGAIGRIPAADEIRANFRVGGSAAKVELTSRQRDICDALDPVLRSEGIIFAGIDVIGDYLTEINITSPTGIRPINAAMGIAVEAILWDAIEKYL